MAPDDLSGETLAFAFFDRRLLVWANDEQARVPALAELEALLAERGVEAPRRQYLGRLGAHHVVALELPELEAPPEMTFRGLRGLHAAITEEHFWLAARAVQVVDWDRNHQFCGRCATPLEPIPAERSKRCPACGLAAYPRLAPAVIVLVRRGEEILLGRSPHFPPGMYSVLAGFVEPGETLEQAVAREILEESGIEVDQIRYFGSQPWPFPNSLMIAFIAEYAGGEIRLEDPEIEDAGWYRASSLPHIPPSLSIARTLIDAFLAGRV